MFFGSKGAHAPDRTLAMDAAGLADPTSNRTGGKARRASIGPTRIEAFVRPEGRAEQLKIAYASTFHLRRILRTRADRSEKLQAGRVPGVTYGGTN
jgi:hypothetical protein